MFGCHVEIRGKTTDVIEVRSTIYDLSGDLIMTESTHAITPNDQERLAFQDTDAVVSLAAKGNAAPTPVKAFSTDRAVEVLDFALHAAEAGRAVALCTLVEIRGGSSRSLGAHMAVADDGIYCGYVSGGCTEAAVAAEALQAISTGHDRFVMLGEGSPFFDIVLPCGGGVTIAVHVLRDITPIRTLLDHIHCRRYAALSYCPSSTSLAFVDGKATTGWHEDEFLSVYRPAVRIFLTGRALEVEIAAKVARAAGYEVLCHDATASKMPDETLIDTNTAVAILQHDLDLEMPVLEAALKCRPFYLGALGSRRTHEKRSQHLKALGYPQADIDRIRAPIGLFGRTRDAQSLALSVIAEIAACRQSDLAEH
jgi:xanthine dehydrogenase accessory factor